jgi:hypothetical protein
MESAVESNPETIDNNKAVESETSVSVGDEPPAVVTLNNNKPDEADTVDSVTVVDVTVNKEEVVATENKDADNNMAVLRKQKNRIVCQCGSANCRKYLF